MTRLKVKPGQKWGGSLKPHSGHNLNDLPASRSLSVGFNKTPINAGKSKQRLRVILRDAREFSHARNLSGSDVVGFKDMIRLPCALMILIFVLILP